MREQPLALLDQPIGIGMRTCLKDLGDDYEGYAPGGVALLIQVLTDNRKRTAPDIRYIF